MRTKAKWHRPVRDLGKDPEIFISSLASKSVLLRSPSAPSEAAEVSSRAETHACLRARLAFLS